MQTLALLLPQEFAPLLLVAAGFSLIVGARGLATGLAVTAGAVLVLPALLAPLFDALPAWLLVVLIAFLCFGLARAAFELLIGKSATGHMIGILAADVVRALVLAPFRLLGWVLVSVWRAWRRPR